MQQHKYTQRELWTRPWNQHRWTGTGQHKSMCVKCYSKRCQHVQNHEWCQDQDLAGKPGHIHTNKILVQQQTHDNLTKEKLKRKKKSHLLIAIQATTLEGSKKKKMMTPSKTIILILRQIN